MAPTTAKLSKFSKGQQNALFKYVKQGNDDYEIAKRLRKSVSCIKWEKRAIAIDYLRNQKQEIATLTGLDVKDIESQHNEKLNLQTSLSLDSGIITSSQVSNDQGVIDSYNHKERWTSEEENQILELVKLGKDDNHISQELNRSKGSIRSRKRVIGKRFLKNNMKIDKIETLVGLHRDEVAPELKVWTLEQDNALKRYLENSIPLHIVAEKFHTTKRCIKIRTSHVQQQQISTDSGDEFSLTPTQVVEDLTLGFDWLYMDAEATSDKPFYLAIHYRMDGATIEDHIHEVKLFNCKWEAERYKRRILNNSQFISEEVIIKEIECPNAPCQDGR
eukprot:NODE_572_length_6559_cov_0.536842.p2 type:complete len:332 gc:universal NODE_572_length_6559_cov_0.536842:4659-3664(-)